MKSPREEALSTIRGVERYPDTQDAQPLATLAIAYAVLDLADAVREARVPVTIQPGPIVGRPPSTRARD